MVAKDHKDSKIFMDELRAGNRKSFDQLAGECLKRLRGYMRVRANNDADADDIVQNALLRAFENIKKFDDSKGSFCQWLQTIVHNEWVRFYGYKKKHLVKIEIGLDDNVAQRAKSLSRAEEILGRGDQLRIEIKFAGLGTKENAQDTLNAFVAGLNQWCVPALPVLSDGKSGFYTEIVNMDPNVRTPGRSSLEEMNSEKIGTDSSPDYQLVSLVVESGLLHLTCERGGPPWQLVAFGFTKFLGWKPQEIAEVYGTQQLSNAEREFEEEFRETAGLSALDTEGEFMPLRRKMTLRVRDVLEDFDSTSLDRFHAILDEFSGTPALQQFAGDTMEKSIADWTFKVKKRVLLLMLRKRGIPVKNN